MITGYTYLSGILYVKHRSVIFLFILTVTTFTEGSYNRIAIQKADSFYTIRGENFDSLHLTADSQNINKAIKLYQLALYRAKNNFKEEIYWKLLRAFYFKAYYTSYNNDLRKSICSQAIKIGENAIQLYPKSGPLYVWLAMNSGLWALENGILKSIKLGLANKLKDYGEKAVQYDSLCFDGAGFMVLGRLYCIVPYIPFFVSWASKEKAIEYMRKSYEINPNNALTALLYAECYEAHGQKQQCIAILKEGLKIKCSPQEGVECYVAKQDMIQKLRNWRIPFNN